MEKKASFHIVGLEELESLDDDSKKENIERANEKKEEKTPILGLPELLEAKAKREEPTVVGIKKVDEKAALEGRQEKKGWPYVTGEDKPSDAIMEMIAGVAEEDEGQPKTLEEINASRKKKF